MPLADQPQYREKLWGYVSRHLLSMGALQQSLGAALQDLVPAAVAAEGAPEALDDERLREMIHRADREQTTALYRSDLPFLFTDQEGRSTFDALRAMISLAHREGIRLDLYLTPHHARAYELIRGIGLWPKYRAWLRELAATAAEIRRLHHRFRLLQRPHDRHRSRDRPERRLPDAFQLDPHEH